MEARMLCEQSGTIGRLRSIYYRPLPLSMSGQWNWKAG